MSVPTLVESEMAKAQAVLADLRVKLMDGRAELTPFLERWVELCVEERTMIYQVSLVGAQVGQRRPHGTPPRIVEVLESCAAFGRFGVYFVKVVADMAVA